jgi:hypothetical protein
MLQPEHRAQDERQIIAEALFARFQEEPTAALRRRLERDEADRQGRLGEKRAR